MKNPNILSLLKAVRFGAYKSFDLDGPFRIELGQNITLIIGRNNCGKSSLIDVVEGLISEDSSGKLPDGLHDLCPSFRIDERHLEFAFSKTTYRNYHYESEFEEALPYLNKTITLRCDKGKYDYPEEQEDSIFITNYSHDRDKRNWLECGRLYWNDMRQAAFRRVNAERDIVPENESDNEAVDENGNGATNLIRKYVNVSGLDETIVEETILAELNKIMEPDVHFDSIRVQQVQAGDKQYKWEVYLGESGHKYALSKSGSGIKTILLILLNLYLIPKTSGYCNKDIFYAFEEIENNLHPALQRRIFEYLYSYAVDRNIKILITTHSHIAINTFFGKDSTKLYHVVKENGHSDLINIENGVERGKALDDLDVKASDLFQANGIIWVEGPSDRIYILRWLSVFCDFPYIEGQHFQFMYYGGRLLSHYEAKERENKTDSFINILTTNRHAAIVMDSDRRNSRGRINETKLRVKKEFEENGYFCWVTKGKEIENYVSSDAVNRSFGSSLLQIEQYELFPDYIKKGYK